MEPKERMYLRLPEELKTKFVAMCDRMGINQQDANIRALTWLVELDDVAQASILKTIRATPDVVKLLAARQRRGKRRP